MGCISLFCCFRNLQPKIIAITALITNIICVAFLIWAIADLHWVFHKRQKVLYIISFVIYIVLLILVIIVLVLIFLRQGGKNLTINNIGKILCLLIIALCIIGFILLLIGYIFELKDYADIEKNEGSGRQIPSHDWAAAILPGLLAFINSIITALCANVLYKIFNDDILTSVLAYQNAYPVNVNQNSITNIPNQDVIVTGNNAGIMPPIYQSGNNLNNK